MSAPRPHVSVCFPAYNEAETVRGVLAEAQRFLQDAGVWYEIIVCNDGSSDETRAIIDEFAGRTPGLRVLHHERNMGIRATLEHLYAEARGELVYVDSVDRQWPAAILLELLPLAAEWDIIVVSRRDKLYGWFRCLVSWTFNAVPRLLFGVQTYDAGANKLFRREVLLRTPVISRSPFAEAERLVRAARAGYRITEFPVDISPRRTGRSRGVSAKVLYQALKDVFRVWLSLGLKRPGVQGPSEQSSGVNGRFVTRQPASGQEHATGMEGVD